MNNGIPIVRRQAQDMVRLYGLTKAKELLANITLVSEGEEERTHWEAVNKELEKQQ